MDKYEKLLETSSKSLVLYSSKSKPINFIKPRHIFKN